MQVGGSTMQVEAATMKEITPSMQLEAAREQENAAALQVRRPSMQK
jgi:hypothetical protein